MSISPQDLYAKLLTSRRGYPLWTPEPSNEFLVERRDGLRIGDVGVVTDDGGFDVLFNICLPQDHPFHRPHGVPEGFIYIDPSGLDIRTLPKAERRGAVISSSSVSQVHMNESSGDDETQRSGTMSYRFTLSSNEGALLILPEGAERRDLLDEGIFLDQASRQGAEWYNYAANRRRRVISHDSLYLLTGLHKTFSWSVVAFDRDSGNLLDTPAHFKRVGGDITASSYTWETVRPSDWRVGPDVDYEIPNQTVFVRGFKIAIRKRLLGSRWISVEAGPPSTRHDPVQSFNMIPSNSSLFDNVTGFLGSMGNRIPRATMRHEGLPDPMEVEISFSRDIPGHDCGSDDSPHIEIQRIPGTPPVYHPSDVINNYLLRKNPSANLSITHDNDWIALFENTGPSVILHEQLGNEASLEKALFQLYRVVLREGIVYLQSKMLQQTQTPPSMFEHKAAPSQASNFNKEFSPMDSLDPVRYALETKSYICRWRKGEDICKSVVQGRDFLEHLHIAHEVGLKSRIVCRWDGCGLELYKASMSRHIQVEHLEWRWPCPYCNATFTWRGALDDHCKGHLAGGQSGSPGIIG